MAEEITIEAGDYLKNKDFLNNSETIFLVENITTNMNGVVHSALRKACFLEDNWGYRPIVLNSMYNLDLSALKFVFRFTGANQTRVNETARIFSVFDYFQNAYPYRQSTPVIIYEPGDGSDGLIYKEVQKNVYKVYDGDRHIKTEHFTAPFGRLRRIDMFDDGKMTKTFFYNDTGHVSKQRIWDLDNQSFFPVEYYYTTAKKLKIKVEYRWVDNPEKDFNNLYDKLLLMKNSAVKYSLYNDEGYLTHELNKLEELIALCLNELTADRSKAYIIVDDEATFMSSLSMVKNPNVAKGVVVHAGFLSDPNNIKSEPQPYYKYMCENRELFDGIAFIADGMKKDFIKKYEFSKRLFTIPHPYAFPIVPRPFEERSGKTAVIVSRFDAIKRINLAIDIFKMVLDKVPDAQLHIYGWGQEKNKIIKHIKDNMLTESVLVKDFTLDVAGAFSGAALSMMTSSIEGLGLTIIESICNGCPVFAFNVKYGPPEVIRNGETGFLFNNNDKASFAKKMIEFFENEDLRKEMSDKCYLHAPDFGVDVFLEKWAEFSEAMYRKARHGVELK